ncbi:hypothetical protein DYU11_05695 [Fibrisoma montanum]|uniref:Uncharacterized protein n=1 Tax=Fibrisoma montanum TaxID=2305895 RepID=A0A418MJW6_9BACT|nr:hypothetical protein [Fibrisoma montanum]RIV27788.1 hypothetical protein DYU11_05695 [Fibrisoma montanum]
MNSIPLLSITALLADYDQWLAFLNTSQHTSRRYERQLTRIGKRYPYLASLSDYLRSCMRQRSQFFGRLASILSEKADKLRSEPTNDLLVQRLTQAHPVMQQLIDQMKQAFADLTESYHTLPVPVVAGGTLSRMPPISLQ